MKHETTSLNTKKIFANSLKNLMNKKPFSKITVTEIISDCKVNRKTFYYHFENIYSLLKWILEEEAIKVIKKFDFVINYKDAIIFVVNYVEENKHILNCAFDAIGREEMRRFFYNDFIDIMYSIINSLENNMKIKIDKDYKDFICNLYTETLSSFLIDLFRYNKYNDCEKIINYLTLTLSSSMPSVLKSAPKA